MCDRLLGLARFDLDTERIASLRIEDTAGVRRARTLYDLALALWDDDGQLAVGHLVDLDRDTRTMVGDLLAELGVGDHSQIDRWLASTETVVDQSAGGDRG